MRPHIQLKPQEYWTDDRKVLRVRFFPKLKSGKIKLEIYGKFVFGAGKGL
jgi:hypothetical protein